MESISVEQWLLGFGIVALGISGWVLPYRWNLLRLKRSFASLFSETTQQRIPKVVGTLVLFLGLIILLFSVAGVSIFPEKTTTPPAAGSTDDS